MKITELIDNRKDKRSRNTLKANPAFAPTHEKLLKLVDCYWNSQYAESPYDTRGFRKPFLNAVRVPTYVSSKATDLDTKNIKIYSDEGQSYLKSYVFNKELKFYFKEENFDFLLNKITYNLPKYGHVLLKKVKGKIYFVPVQNDYSDPTDEGISSPMVEYHEKSFAEVEQMNWDNKKQIIDVYKAAGKDKVILWEITGKVDDDSYEYRVVSCLEYGRPVYAAYAESMENNYKQLKWEDVPGRHMGRGVVEEQFESQIAINENEYLFRLGLQWTAKKLFQTKDIQAVRNLLNDAYNGDVLTVNSAIDPIAMEERNLGAFQYADAKWSAHSESQTFSSDILRGDRPPSGTPATTSVLQAQQAGGYYNLKRQNTGIFIKEVIEDWILPEFKKANGKAHKVHIMKLLGNDNGSSVFFNSFLGQEVNKKVLDFMSKGKILSKQELDLLKALTAEKLRDKDIDIPSDFYDFDYSVDVVVTGEQVDLATRATALQTAFQVMGSNPTVLQDPIVRRTYFKLLEATGVNPAELYDEETPNLMTTIQNTAQRGGSLPRATAPSSAPAISSVPTTV